MKKIFITLFFVILLFLLTNNIEVGANIIPSEAIRLRVVANSNGVYDQEIKIKVKERVEKILFDLLKDTKGIEEAREIMNNNLKLIEDDVNKLLESENYNQSFTVNFGYNYFPDKEYKGIIYEEGLYESLLITLGSGEGDNWWCVLFPPLCLIEAEESTEVEYKFFIKELIDKYL